MTPAAALEYVRSRRPRVLLAPVQWRVSKNISSYARTSLICYFMSFLWCILITVANKQAVQEYKQHRLASTGQSPSADAVLITKADLEGYHSSCDTVSGKELAIINRVTRSRPMIAKLSCLFASLKVSGSYTPVTRQLTEARAC